jgi:hypothetical protein
MKNSILRTILLGALSAGAWMTGCAVDSMEAAQPERIGQVAIELQIAPGIAPRSSSRSPVRSGSAAGAGST